MFKGKNKKIAFSFSKVVCSLNVRWVLSMSEADIYGWAEAKSHCELNKLASRQHIKNNLIVNGSKDQCYQ